MDTVSKPTLAQASPEAKTQAAKTTGAHLVFGLIFSLISVGLLAWIWDQVKDRSRETTQFDRVILYWMHTHQTPWLTAIARVLAHMGSPPVIVGIALVAAVIGLFWRRVRGAAWTLPIGVIGAGVIIQGIKMEFKRPRPTFFDPLLHETGYSFPSGHSLIAIVVYGLIGYFIMHLFQRHAARVLVGTLTVLLILSIGISRPYVQVHYPTDVLAGWAAGLPWLIACLGLHEKLTRRYQNIGEPVLHLPPQTEQRLAQS